MQKKRWADLSLLQKIGIIVGATFQFGLLALGLWDLAHRPAAEIRGDKRFWWGFMFVNWIGPLAYFTYGRRESPLLAWRRGGAEPAVDEEIALEESAGFDGPAVV